MNLATLLNAIDGTEQIIIIHCNSSEELYKGQKVYIHDINFGAEVSAIYITNGKMVIEVYY